MTILVSTDTRKTEGKVLVFVAAITTAEMSVSPLTSFQTHAGESVTKTVGAPCHQSRALAVGY